MTIEVNEQKIVELSQKYNNANLKLLKRKNYDYLEYLQNNCELKLRRVLRKYYNGAKLNSKDIKLVSGYVFFSNPILFSGQVDGPDEDTLLYKAQLGSGNFTQEEKNIFEFINNKAKEKVRN